MRQAKSIDQLIDVLDGAMIVIAMYTINFFHPGILLGHINPGHRKNRKLVDESKDASDVEVSGKANQSVV